MRFPDYKWCDTAIGGVGNRNNVVEIIDFVLPEKGVDCYRTVYRYPDAFKSHFDDKRSVSGYTGPVYADYFPIDIDSSDLEKALQETRRLLERLHINYDVDLSQIRCFFSGAKGFHVMIPDESIGWEPSDKLPQIFKRMAEELLEGIEYDGSIYDVVRLFRFANSINSKTGLYKIPLEPREILHSELSQIIEMAKTPRNLVYCDCERSVELRSVYQEAKQRLDERPAEIKTIRPAKQKLCYLNILDGVSQGWRDNCALRLVSHFFKQGLSEDIVTSIIRTWNGKCDPPIPDKELVNTIHSAMKNTYDFGCNDDVLKEFCDERCHLKRKVDTTKVYTITEAEEKYKQYIRQLEKKKITLGIPKLDYVIRGIAPGEVCLIMARSSVGKTAFLLNIIKHLSLKNITVLFFSLEQPLAQIYERGVQISSGVEGQQVEEVYKLDRPEKERYFKTASNSYKNMLAVEEDYLTAGDLKWYLKAAELKAGREIDVICIDYLGRMKASEHNAYEATSGLAKEFKHLAKETDKAVIYLHQTSRNEGKSGAEPLTITSGRDSGQTEEAADFVIGMWRPDIDKAQDSNTEKLIAAVLKNRKGMRGHVELEFNKKTLAIYQQGEAPFVGTEIAYTEEDIPF